jgi:hypothetical protein
VISRHVKLTGRMSSALAGAEEIAQRCPRCGSQVITACEACGYRVRGQAENVFGGQWSPPDFCDNCGTPHPWLSRQGRIYLLQNMLDEEDLDPATRLEVQEQLDALTDPDLDEEEQAARWAKVQRLAPTLWEKSGAQKILETVVSAAIKTQLGL